jgi:biotin/methionine sulfoxide reductase
MGTVLAAMLGQIGLPGGGIGYGYGATGSIGNPAKTIRAIGLPPGKNKVQSFIPVARIADMLLHPGEPFDYNGQHLVYPDIRLIYWCGGNPFHHHQDLNRLVRAWQRPQTIIVHEPWWNALARHADIVLPATTPLERNDIGKEASDPIIFAMQQAIRPVGDARNDYDMFSALADRLGFGQAFTEGCDEDGWLRRLYTEFRGKAREEGIELPEFDTFWWAGHVDLSIEEESHVLLEEFRRDPEANPLPTPSGRIEIFSETIEGFGYDDCPGHPVWLEPAEWLGAEYAEQYPLHLISNQPSTRLHSQYDLGAVSVANKVQGREPLSIHPNDAAVRGIEDGDIVRVFNDRGACLAGVRITDRVCPGVVVLSTGAWYDPETPGGLERHGNPNVLTLDKGTSRLAQGSVAHTALVEVETITQQAPAVQAFVPPDIRAG